MINWVAALNSFLIMALAIVIWQYLKLSMRVATLEYNMSRDIDRLEQLPDNPEEWQHVQAIASQRA